MRKTDSPNSATSMLVLTIDGAPPSTNRIYGINKWGGKYLRKEGKAYRNRVKDECRSQWMLKPEALRGISGDKPYDIEYWFFLPKLRNKTFGNQQSGAKSRFRKVDVTNLVKVIEDAIFECLGIDDRCAFNVHLYKRESDEPGVLVYIREVPEEEVFET